jgi:hypothetical protein
MRAHRRFAPTGGRLRLEWVAGIIGIRRRETEMDFIKADEA